jgi:hypothetical protein
MSSSCEPDAAHTRLRWVLGQALFVLCGIVVYFGVRGLTEGSEADAVARSHDIMAFERRLGLDIERALQAPVRDSQTLETAANWTYIWGHWPVIIATMLWLAWHHRPVFLRLRDAMLVSGAAGMLVFAGWHLLVGISIATAASSVALKAVGVLMPPLMCLAVLVTGNHYVVDVVAGVALVLVGHLAALLIERHLRRPPPLT